jgi:hypothetical protein
MHEVVEQAIFGGQCAQGTSIPVLQAATVFPIIIHRYPVVAVVVHCGVLTIHYILMLTRGHHQAVHWRHRLLHQDLEK